MRIVARILAPLQVLFGALVPCLDGADLTNLSQLLKNVYDPMNVFQLNQNIAPNGE